MPGGFLEARELCNEAIIGISVGNPFPVSISTGINAAESAFTTLISSTSSDASFIIFSMNGDNSDPSYGISADLAIGPAGQEQVIVPDICFNASGAAYGGTNLYNVSIPVHIPAGTRLSIRGTCVDATTAGTVSIWAALYDAGFSEMEGCSGFDVLGYVSGSVLGTSVTPGLSYTYGSWTQLIASTSRDYIGEFVVVTPGDAAAAASDQQFVQIGIGASGVETPIRSFTFGMSPYGPTGLGAFAAIGIPAGTRVSARCASSASTSGAASVAAVTVYGGYK